MYKKCIKLIQISSRFYTLLFGFSMMSLVRVVFIVWPHVSLIIWGPVSYCVVWKIFLFCVFFCIFILSLNVFNNPHWKNKHTYIHNKKKKQKNNNNCVLSQCVCILCESEYLCVCECFCKRVYWVFYVQCRFFYCQIWRFIIKSTILSGKIIINWNFTNVCAKFGIILIKIPMIILWISRILFTQWGCQNSFV